MIIDQVCIVRKTLLNHVGKNAQDKPPPLSRFWRCLFKLKYQIEYFTF